jgi:hypothetical protein
MAAASLLHWDGVSDARSYMSADLVPEGEPQSFATAAVQCEIADARREAGLTLDTAGFELLPAGTALGYSDFFNAGAVTGAYYDECTALLRRRTGAPRVVAFDHNLRHANLDLFQDSSADGDDGDSRAAQQTGPVLFVHNDYTDTSGPQRVADLAQVGGSYTVDGRALLSVAEVAACVGGRCRFAFVNVWRPINHPVSDVPLAVCDARSMRDSDFASCALVYSDRVGETHLIAHQPRHRWLYYSDQTRDEALLLKCWDSRGSSKPAGSGSAARFTAHTAFENPLAESDAPPRESIEVRCLLIWDEGDGGLQTAAAAKL